MAEPGPLEPIDGWGRISRGRFETQYAGHRWTVDVDFFDWDQKVGLYRDAEPVEQRKAPATFRLDASAVIEVATSAIGMQRAELVVDGEVQAMSPAAGTPEAWRLRLEWDRPGLSHAIETATPLVLLVAAVVGIGQLLALAGVIDTDFLPAAVKALIGVTALAAFIDRSLRPGD